MYSLFHFLSDNILRTYGLLLLFSCLTLCDCMDWSMPGSSVHGISQMRIQEWVAISFPRMRRKSLESQEMRTQKEVGYPFLLQGIFLSHLESLKLWHNITTRILTEIRSTDLFQTSSTLFILLCVYLVRHSFIRCIGLWSHHTHSQDIDVNQHKALVAFITT